MTCTEKFKKNGVIHNHQWLDWPNHIKVLTFITLIKSLDVSTQCSICGKTPHDMLQNFESYKKFQK